MSKKTHKKTDTKIKKPDFIRFSELQRNYLRELYARHMGERDKGLESVYKELGILEKVLEAPPGTYQLRSDLSGLDILPPPPDPPKDPPVEDPKDIKPPEKNPKGQIISKEKS